MLEDSLYFDEYDGHFPYYAGGIDEIYGISASGKREAFESRESFELTMKMLTGSESPIDFSTWSWV